MSARLAATVARVRSRGVLHRARLALAAVLVPAVLVVPAACAPGAGAGDAGPVCTELFAYGLVVVVTDDAPPGDRICDAVVTAEEGDFLEPLQLQGEGADCVYVGAGERAGTYRVEATKDGYSTDVAEDVVVTADECHVEGVEVALGITAVDG